MTSRLIRTLRLERTIVFCNTKVMCQRLRDDLVRMGLDADCIHGDIPQQKREKTMRTFKDGKLPILIATDVARAASTSTMWTASSTTTCRRRTSIISTASAARAVPEKGHRRVHPRHVPGAGEAGGDREIFPLCHTAREIRGGRFPRRGGAAEAQKGAAAPPLPLTAAETGLLLLCCALPEAEDRPLTMAQFQELAKRARVLGPGGETRCGS